jgi:feruloyl-CoA synthase
MERCSMAARGEIVPMVSAWGMTETSPMSTCVHFAINKAGVIGLPGPGTDIRLGPVDGRFEIQVRGPNVTPGYWRRPDLTSGAFVDGWFRTGDAAKLEDPADPAKGIVFDGRIAENFKLTSATWVNVGMVRIAVLAAAPMLADAVIAGHDRDEVTLLGFPNLPACRELCPELGRTPTPATVVGHPSVRMALADSLARHNAKMPGNSTAIMRAILLAEPPSIDADEITDKGYINQRAVLTRRAALVEQLYAKPADAVVITVPAQV